MQAFTGGSSRIFFKDCTSFVQVALERVYVSFDESCLKAFGELKETLVSAPIIISPDWNSPFEVMCDASGGGSW